ncbi:MAG: adenine deaminase [Clostridia bacterium]|nr:adenine deaminase [Clostridia bacterium]
MSSVIHLQEKCDAASGRVKAQMVLKQANIINVFTEEIIQADLAICGDTIVGIGSYQGEVEIDCRDKFICPGFIDAHVHVESTMVMPSDLAKEVLKSGTTTMIADPHELVNVTGIKALEFLIEATEDIPINLYIMLPSCVPSTKFETNGKSFTAEDMVPFLNHPRVLGLGEVMSYNDVINGQEEMLKKLIVNEGKVLDGHAPDLIGKELQAYACAGIETDHECVNFQEAYEKVKAGLKILIREGSAAKNLEAIVKGLIESKIPTDNFMFCTDDKHLEDIQREGHISWNIKQAIGLGMSPITAIKMASYNTARAYGLKKLGAVAAGYRADLVILEDLENMKVSQVIKDGIIITDESFANNKDKYIDKAMLNTVKFDNLTAEKIKVKAFEKNYVIEMMPHQIITKKVYEEIPSQYGYFTANEIYSKLCVIERHRGSGNVAAAPLKGFGIKGGAIATSVAHDSHNIIAAGDKDEDIILAVNRLKEIQGGYVIASKGKIIGELPLQVAGLISTLPSEKVQSITKEMLALARAMGVPAYLDPFITLSFMALPVIPEIRLTDLGLFDVEKFDLI